MEEWLLLKKNIVHLESSRSIESVESVARRRSIGHFLIEVFDFVIQAEEGNQSVNGDLYEQGEGLEVSGDPFPD